MQVFTELRQAGRSLVLRPGYTLLAVFTLALGIGANTAIFSAFHRITLQPFPLENLDRMSQLFRSQAEQGFSMAPPRQVTDAWRRESESFDAIAYWSHVELTLTGEGAPVVLKGVRSTENLPHVTGVQPLLGRMFTADELTRNDRVVVLAEGVWRGMFGGDTRVIGRTVALGGESWAVIGVMPARFRWHDTYTPSAEFWVPFDSRSTRQGSPMALGLLREGVTREAAEAELLRIAEGISAHTDRHGEWTYTAVPVRNMVDGNARKALPILLGAVALVLLIACANVAALLLVRLGARGREIGVRLALGASRRRILATLAVEQLLLAVAAGGVGLLVASWAMALMRTFRPENLKTLDIIGLEPPVLLFAGVLVIATTVLFGVLPVYAALRRDAGLTMRGAGDARVTGGNRVREVLVSAQIALSVMLLVGAVLLLRSFQSLRETEVGFDATNRYVVQFTLPNERYSDRVQIRAFYDDLVEGTRQIPGVLQAVVGSDAPPDLGLIFGSLQIEGRPGVADDVQFMGGGLIDTGFLPAIGARFIAGRDFQPGEENVVIVNRAFAERFWPGQDAVGGRIRTVANPDAPWVTITGVVESVGGERSLRRVGELQYFVPMSWDWPMINLVVHTDGARLSDVLPALRQVAARIDEQVPVREAASIADRLAASLARERFITGLLIAFAALALILTAIGLYGLVAYTVQQRTREVGIRVALGATPRIVSGLFLTHGVRLTAIGIAAGVAGAWASMRMLAAVQEGVQPYDGAAFAAAIAVITLTALLASWLPARRAARVDPLEALRSE